MNSTAMNLTKLEDKYGVQAKPEPDDNTSNLKPVITHWQDSEPVVMLSVFLKEYNNYGFEIQQTREGLPVLGFDPGLKNSDSQERWDLAEHAWFLMEDAKDDLEHLVFIGALSFPVNNWL